MLRKGLFILGFMFGAYITSKSMYTEPMRCYKQQRIEATDISAKTIIKGLKAYKKYNQELEEAMNSLNQ